MPAELTNSRRETVIRCRSQWGSRGMNSSANDTTADRPSDHEVVFRRSINAPRDVVWAMWSDEQHINRWWGPDGFTTTTYEFAFEPGGVWRYMMHGPDGTDYPNRVVFREIERPSRIVYENSWDLPGAPVHFTATVMFVSAGTKTELEFRMNFPDATALASAVDLYKVMEGGRQTFARLASHVATTTHSRS